MHTETYTRKRFRAFCVVSTNELVVLDSLENMSKQYKNAGKRFRVYAVRDLSLLLGTKT